MDNELKYETEQVKKLVGYVITEPIHNEGGSDSEPGFGFVAKHPKTGDEQMAWIDRDPEGNGPGHLHVQGKHE